MAGQADGSIVVDTELQTEGFEKGSKEMQRAVRSLQSKVDNLAPTMKKAMRGSASALESFEIKSETLRDTISSLEDKLVQLGEMRLPTEDYKWLQTEISKAEKELDKLLTKEAMYEDMDVNKSSQKWKNLQYNIEQTKQKLEEYKAEAAQMENDGTAFSSGSETAEYEQLREALEAAKESLSDMVQRFERGTSAIAKFGGVVGKGVVGGLKGMVSMLGKGAAAMLKLSLRTKKTHSRFNSGIGTLLRYGLGVRSLFTLMNKLRSALVDGYKNLARYSDRTNAAISSMMSALTRLKNSFAAAFDPILQVAAPALTTLINLISEAVSRIGMLTAALTGAKYYTKATEIQEDYAASLDNTTDSAKKAKKALAGFDELNILDDKTTEKNDGSVDPSQMFEQIPVDSAVLEFAQKLKEAFESADWQELGTLLGEKVNEVIESVDWAAWGTKLGTYLNGAIQTIYYTVDTVDWVGIGNHLAEAVNGIIDAVDWDTFGRLFAKRFTAALDVVGGFLEELDWTDVLKAFTSGFTGFYNELREWLESKDWREIGETFTQKLSDALQNGNVEGAVKSFFDAFTTALNSAADLLDGVNFYQLGQDLVDLLVQSVGNVDWAALAQAIGRLIGEAGIAALDFCGGLVADIADYFEQKVAEGPFDSVGANILHGILDGIVSAIAGIGTWIVQNVFEPFWNGLCDAFEIHSPSKKMAEIGRYIVDGLLEGIKELPAKFKAKLDETIDKVASWGKELGKNLKESAEDASSKAINAFKEFATDLKKKLDAALDKVKDFGKDLISKLKSSASDAVSDAVDQIQTMASKFGSKFDAVIDKAKTFASNLISKIKGGAADAVSNAVSQLASMPQKVSEKLNLVIQKAATFASDLKDDFYNAGKNALLGIVNGISAKIDEVKTSISNVGTALITTFQNLLGIHSPSRVFAEQGRYIAEGLIQGLTAATDDVSAAAASLASAAVKAAEDEIEDVGKTTLEKIKENLSEIEDAFDDDTGLGKLNKLFKDVFSVDWNDIDTDSIVDIAKDVGTLLFDSLDKETRLSMSDFVKTSLKYLNDAYEENGLAGMAGAAKTIVTSLSENLTGNNSKSILEGAGKGVIDIIQSGMENGLSGLWSLISSIPGKIVELLSGGFGQLKEWGSQFIGWLQNLFSTGSSSTQATTKNWTNNLGNTVKQFISDTSSNSNSFMNGLKNTFGSGLSGVQTTTSNLLDGIKTVFSSGFNSISTGAGTLWNTVKSVFSSGMSGVASTVGSGLSGIVSTVGGTVGKIASTVGGGLSGIVSTVGSGISGIVSTVGGGLSAVASGAAGLAGTVGTALSGAVATAGTALGGLGTTLAGLATAGGPIGLAVAGVGALGAGLVTAYNKCDWFKEGVNNAFNSVKNAISGAVEVGKNIVTGIGSGIKSAASGLWNGIKNVGSSIVNGFKSFFGIHSPSTLMADEVGEYLTEGIDEGMKNAMPALLSSTEDQMADLVDTVKNGAQEADAALVGSGMPLLSEVSGKVDIVEGMDGVLTQFSDKVASSFTELLNRMSQIVESASFSMPAVAAGTVVPYSMSSGNGGTSNGGKEVLEEIKASNDETVRLVIQAIGSATNSICAAVEEYSGTTVNYNGDSVAQDVINTINRKTRMFGKSPLLTPTEVSK